MEALVGLFGPAARVAVELLANSLWQGLVAAALAGASLRMIPRANAATKHAVWLAALAGVVVIPLVTMSFRPKAGVPAEARIDAIPLIAVQPEPPAVQNGPSPAALLPVSPIGERTAGVLFAGWVMVTLCLVLRLVGSHVLVLRLKRNSEPLTGVGLPPGGHTRRSVDLRSSREIGLPMLAGFRRPAILFPRELLPRLTAEDTRKILLHEIAHVRRWDDWTNLGQKAIESALFFHPAVRFIARNLDFEREMACDDWVVAISGPARHYAACLARLAALNSAGPRPCVAVGTARDRKQVFRRVQMLLNRERNSKPHISKAAVGVALMIITAACLVAAHLGPVVVVASPAPQAAAAPVQPAAPEQPQARPLPSPATNRQGPRGDSRTRQEAEKEIARIVNEMRPAQEEIRKLAAEIQQQVQSQIQQNTAEIHKLTEQIRQEIQTSIQPRVAEIQQLARLYAESTAAKPDEEKVRKLEEQIRKMEGELMRPAEERIRALEKQIRAYEDKMRPAEGQIKELERKVHELEQEIHGKEREIHRLERRLEEAQPPLPPTAPAPPAKPAAPASPAPPASPGPR